ncbi:MAG TPA: hypothetical protein VEN28_00485 [Burkholderiaceae bacterium]|nr:hypothetical protein [Burkholderiaceae bacterium]
MTRTATDKAAKTVLDAEHVAFMSGDAISSAVAGRDASNQPSVAKALAVRVRSDRGTVEVFVDTERSGELLRDLRAGYPIALVCSEPRSHRTIQVKGQRTDIEPLAPGDEQFVGAKVDALVAHIAQLGYAEDGLRAYFAFTPSALTRIIFAASAAFLQTPGPGAGAPLKT